MPRIFLAPGAQDVEQIFIMCHSLATCHRQRLISEWVIRERRKSFSVKPGGNDVQCCAVAVAEQVVSNTALCSLYMPGLLMHSGITWNLEVQKEL